MKSGCRLCGGKKFHEVLSLGLQPLANALVAPDRAQGPEDLFPLDLVLCAGCGLVQIREGVPPERLFGEYLYFSSYSDTMCRHARDLAGRMLRARRLGPGSLVMEAASNDGYLLRNFAEAGVPVLGIEPARNVAAVAEAQYGVPTRVEFFGEESARRLVAEGMRADVFFALNVLAHVPDPNGFVAGIRSVLSDDGVAVIEAPYVRDLVDHCEFDTIYHEHLSYFSVAAARELLRRGNLVLVDVERIPIHGGSLRLFAAREGEESAAVTGLMREEEAWGGGRPGTYAAFSGRVRAIRDALRDVVGGLRADGKRLAAYGAAAKGAVLLNYCGLGRNELEYVVDRNPAKQGKSMPGVHLEVFPPERLLETQPDVVLLLTWNFAREILHQQREYLERGGRFLIPIPAPRLLSDPEELA